MPRLQGRHEVHRRTVKLQHQFDEIGGATLSPALVSQYSRYLCILVAGHVEQSLKELATHYARERSDARLTKYVAGQLKRLQNVDADKLRQLVEAFDTHWWSDIEATRPDEIDAFGSVAAIRNRIAHGEDAGITLSTIQQYFRQVCTVLDDLCDLFHPR